MNLLMGKLDQLLARATRSQSPSPARRQYFNCIEAGHFKRDCPKLRSSTTSPARGDRCYRCNELGHMARDCPKQATDKVGDTPRAGRKVSFADLNGKRVRVEGPDLIHNANGLPVIIRQIRSDSMFRVDVRVNGLEVKAVVDTAAEVTLVSDRVVAQLPEEVPVLEHVYMKTAGRGLQMNGFIVGPVTIQLGDLVFQERVYVAPIEDCMLLGVDFLRKHGATIDIVGATMCLNGKVTVARTVIIPPNSVAMSKCSLGKPIDTFAIEAECGDLMVPMSVHVSDAGLRLPMLNMSDRHVRLKQGKLVGIGCGRGKDMLRGSLGRFVVKAVSDFRFIQEWLMHGTDPPGNLCKGCGGCCSMLAPN
ncbi:hypothetical protein DPMN_000764 [Dreissena polymorpha]|uniref:CCHC-type domain-containing protein n=1 Tax=Dreissena polymorpha TaxID=45954 RepID=A0A9D4MKD6_DREPO|nr:hypothetical protein DPMN_000764 [Dreissena polymorpha]